MTKFSTSKQEKIREARAKAARWAEEQVTLKKKRKAADETPPSSPDIASTRVNKNHTVKEGNGGTPKLDRTSSPMKSSRKKMRTDAGDTTAESSATPSKKKSKQQLIQEARERARIAMSAKKSKAAPHVESSSTAKTGLPAAKVSMPSAGDFKPVIKPSSAPTMVSVTKKSSIASTTVTTDVASRSQVTMQKINVLHVEADSEERLDTPQLISPQSDADVGREELFDKNDNMLKEANDVDDETTDETKKTSIARTMVKFVGLAFLLLLFFPAYYIVNPHSTNQLVVMSGDTIKNVMDAWNSAVAVEGEVSRIEMDVADNEIVAIDVEVYDGILDREAIEEDVPTNLVVEL
mmetsp:Transcript_7261/g.10706  ORF Transcript_7261/g.10706 Transcript_7261/m.10706 type:complete len:350 (-) Transcript_7261:298-1347(-)|eukprot:CAMPEP_0196802884 /NCGR_PEP_ID=MMETSP1362-20130617/2405_1 /TAXON_ID=163516 /ORGANISM="Leptocylindrus danicus, Strain CCMP1856" /LENGTH=349 /DNA_ID=CAMNT_0042174287 /DNA_START=13 /DNA_END=1062 /DNA_ORIENTATION=-